MTKIIETFIACTPKGKARPRVSVRYGKAHFYQKQPDRSEQNLITLELRKAIFASEAMAKLPTDQPISVCIKVFKLRPKKSKFNHPVSKPDVDNYAKLILDAASRFVFNDDAQVVSLYISKVYCDQAEDQGFYVRFDLA